MTDLAELNRRIIELITTDSKRLAAGVTVEIQALQAAALVEIARELHDLNNVMLPTLCLRIRDVVHELQTARKA